MHLLSNAVQQIPIPRPFQSTPLTAAICALPPLFPAAGLEAPTNPYSQSRSKGGTPHRFRGKEFLLTYCLVNGNDPAELIRNLTPLDAGQGIVNHL